MPWLMRYLKRLFVSAGRAEAGELAHRPEPAAVHGRLRAAGERELAGQPDALGLLVLAVRQR